MPRLISEAARAARVPAGKRVSSGVDVVGDIAILRLSGLSEAAKKRVGKAILGEVRNVRCVFNQEGAVEGDYRLRSLEHLAGEDRTMTTHRENGCVFKVDVATCYFSPRLSTERLRVAKMASPAEKVLNMFAGVGPYSIPIARLSGARVTSCELNPRACEFHRENDRMNKVEGLVKVVEGDAINLPRLTRTKFDRVLMPHPSQADEFLPTALRMAKKGGVIHYYRHLLGNDEEEAAESLKTELRELLPPLTRYTARRVRVVGPRWVELCAEIRVRG